MGIEAVFLCIYYAVLDLILAVKVVVDRDYKGSKKVFYSHLEKVQQAIGIFVLGFIGVSFLVLPYTPHLTPQYQMLIVGIIVIITVVREEQE